MSYPVPNFTQIPNLLLEEHIKAMTEAEMRVALAIARKTFGWHKRQDKLSLSQLMDLTGMSRQGVINGIEAGIARGIIRREQDGQSFLYELVILERPVNEVDQCKDAETSQRSRPTLVNEVDQLDMKTSQRSRHTKERNKRNNLKKGDQGVDSARAAAPTPAQPATPKISLLPNDGYEIPIPPTNGHTKRYTKVTKDYYDPRRLVDGYIPAGQGITAIEVYHEWVAPSARRLSQPNQADITQQATDLERWRQAVKAWVQSGHRPENVKGLLDWYHDPSRIPGNKPASGATKAQPEVTFKQWLLNTYHSTFAATIKPESELRDEYRQWRKANGLPPAG